MKKIYFACSISGGRDHAHVYEDIVKIIKVSGARVLCELFADKTLKANIGPTPHLKEYDIWKNDVAWVKSANAIIAEITQPSLGVGYEIGLADELGIPILALFDSTSKRRPSPMIVGNPNVALIKYTKVEELSKPINDFLKEI